MCNAHQCESNGGEKNGLLESGLLVSFFLDNQLSQLVLLNNRGSQGENVKGINLTLKKGGGGGRQRCVNTKIFQARNFKYSIFDIQYFFERFCSLCRNLHL